MGLLYHINCRYFDIKIVYLYIAIFIIYAIILYKYINRGKIMSNKTRKQQLIDRAKKKSEEQGL